MLRAGGMASAPEPQRGPTFDMFPTTWAEITGSCADPARTGVGSRRRMANNDRAHGMATPNWNIAVSICRIRLETGADP